MKSALLVLLFATALYSATAQRIAPDTIPLGKGSLIIQPIMHASVVLTVSGKTIYVDPVGGAAKYQGLAAPDFILITHIHGDHFDSSTIAGIKTEVVEVHISNVYKREEFRHVSMLARNCRGVIAGFGMDSYRLAIESFITS